MHNDIHSLENKRKHQINLTEINQLENYKKSMIGMNNIKQWEKDKTYKKVFYYSKATLNYLKKSAIDCENEINKYEDNLAKLGLNVVQENKKFQKSQYVNTDIIMMKMKERLNEKMKQKKEKEKRDRRRLREEMEMIKLKKERELEERLKQKEMKYKDEDEKNNENQRYDNNKSKKEEEKKEEEIKEEEIKKEEEKKEEEEIKKEEKKEDEKKENEENENEEKEEKEEEFKTNTTFNFISENSKGLNLINKTFLIHDNSILVGDRISLFQTMIPTFRRDKLNLLKELEEENQNTSQISNKEFDSEEYFKNLNKIKSEILTKEIEKKTEKKTKHSLLIKPIIDQIFDIVNEVEKYQIEENIDLIDKEKWNDLTEKLINKEEIDSDKINAMREKKDIDSIYEFDNRDNLTKKEDDELYDYCNFIGIWNDKIIPDDIKGFKFNYIDLYFGIYKNNNGIDIKDYEPIPEEIENLCLPEKKNFNPQFGEIIDISLENKFKFLNNNNINKEKHFVDPKIIPISKHAIYNYIPIKISMIGNPLSGKKIQSKFLQEKYNHLKIYNLEDILNDIVREYDELQLPIEENPKFKNAKKNQVDQIREEIEKKREDFK